MAEAELDYLGLEHLKCLTLMTNNEIRKVLQRIGKF